MKSQIRILFPVVLSLLACKSPPPPASSPAVQPVAAAVKPAEAAPPPPSSNPAIAEFTPLWADIAKCDKTYELDADKNCPANFKLIGLVKDAYDNEEKQPERFKQVYLALVDEVVHGKETKGRTCAAYAAWSHAAQGGKAFGGDAKVGLEVADAIAALSAATDAEYLGNPMVDMLMDWWKVDGEVRKRMVRILLDRKTQSISARRELLRTAGFDAAKSPTLVEALATVAQRVDEPIEVRGTAIEAVGGAAAEAPELVELLVLLRSDPNAEIVRVTERALSTALTILRTRGPDPKVRCGKFVHDKVKDIADAAAECVSHATERK